MADDNAAPTTEAGEQKRDLPLSLLASEMFGPDFHGEVRKDEPASRGQPEGEKPEGESEEAPEAEEGAQEKPEGETEEEAVVSSLQELIEQNEWDPEWVNALKVPVKIDGKDAEATFKDLRDSYQMRAAAEHRLEEAKSKAKAANDEIAKKSEAAEQQIVAAAELVKSFEARLNDEAAAVNWKDLRDKDPAEYAAKKQEIAERRADIEEMKRKAVQTWQKSKETQAQETIENLKQRIVAEQAALLEVPVFSEWRDPDKAKAGKAKLAEYLPTQGFSRDEIMGASDHRLLVLAEKARRYDEGQTKTDVARKKLAKVPKVMKPGASKPSDQLGREKADKLTARLRQTGSLDDAYAVLQARKTGG